MSIDPVFAVSAAVTVAAGLGVVSQRNPVHCAISMLACFLGLAVLYLKLAANSISELVQAALAGGFEAKPIASMGLAVANAAGAPVR